MALALLWVVRAGAAEAPGTTAAQAEGVCSAQQVGLIDTQSNELHLLILESLSSDTAPFSYAHSGSRTVIPVTRLNPYHKFTAGVLPRLLELAPVCVQQGAEQQKSVARIRAALDESGYYVFALRKIII